MRKKGIVFIILGIVVLVTLIILVILMLRNNKFEDIIIEESSPEFLNKENLTNYADNDLIGSKGSIIKSIKITNNGEKLENFSIDYIVCSSYIQDDGRKKQYSLEYDLYFEREYKGKFRNKIFTFSIDPQKTKEIEIKIPMQKETGDPNYREYGPIDELFIFDRKYETHNFRFPKQAGGSNYYICEDTIKKYSDKATVIRIV